MNIKALYKSAIEAHKRSFDAGYSTALNDILNFIQQGVSSNDHKRTHPSGMDGEGMTIGRIMDFLEARLEAIGTQEEDVQSDDDKTVKQQRPPIREELRNTSHINTETLSSVEHTKGKSPVSSQSNPISHSNRSVTPTIHSGPSSPNIRAQPLPLPRRTKGRARSKDFNIPFSVSSIGNSIATNVPFTFTTPDNIHILDSNLESSGSYNGLGKRRQAPESEGALGQTNSVTFPQCPTFTRSQKRRTKLGQASQHGSSRMDVEEDQGGVRERDRRRPVRR